MKDEIKGILEYLTKFINDKEEITKYGCEISVKKAKILLDYITNLQEELKSIKSNYNIQLDYDKELEKEIKRLKEINQHLLIDLRGESEYKERCLKAIKYIEQYLLPKHSIENTDWEFDEVIFSDLPVEAIKPLVDILQGSDDNE